MVPKIPEANILDQFIPIALGNFLYKIFTKILVDCMACIASRILSEN